VPVVGESAWCKALLGFICNVACSSTNTKTFGVS
jgi:hypothetical protein